MSQQNQQLLQEINRRRTFAIISHPDAGKTTLTEKLLLYGGAIRLAGSVKARKAQKHAVSDWMEIEKQRGISVTSSVMQFEYNHYCINILDTPGHQDFSEDTYRTLVAADSAVMLIDAAKGVEEQTIKLFHVCKLRGIPIFTFVNKLDRAGKDPFLLMEEIENVLGIRSYPMNWPIGTDGDFKGVYHRDLSMIEVFNGGDHGQTQVSSQKGSVNDPAFKELLGLDYYHKLCGDIELLDMAGDAFNLENVLDGTLTPIFFGSAMTNFGVQSFFDRFLHLTLPPVSRQSNIGIIKPDFSEFSAFIFKIQANMNPTHRDRIAFMRVCSGRFERGMSVRHVQGNKEIKLAQPQQFMAQERTMVEDAYPGDIIGFFDPGFFRLGDTLCTGNIIFQYEGIPVFAPEHFARVTTINSMKRKQFIKGISELSEEGAIQYFKQVDIGREELIIGVVGALQFEVLEYRLKNEYGVEIRINQLPFRFVRWIGDAQTEPKHLKLTSSTMIAHDQKGKMVLFFENDWSIRWALENNPNMQLLCIS